ncbi:MAG TPA: permease, partial [bacterium]
PTRKSGFRITMTFIVLLCLLLAVTGFAYYRSPALAWEGLSGGTRLFFEILPNIVIGFLLGGLVQVLLPQHLVAHYAGEDSGVRGLLIATGVGAITPGGPFVQFPLVASLWRAGTGVGPITAYIVSWALLGFQRIMVYEGPILGWQFVWARVAACLMMPSIVGYITSLLYRNFSGS